MLSNRHAYIAIILFVFSINLFSLNAYADGGNIPGEPFGLAGLSLGTPGIINVTAGGYGKRFGFQASVSIIHVIECICNGDTEESDFDDTFEDTGEENLSAALLQLNLNCRLYQKNQFLLSFSIAGGSIYIENEGIENDLAIMYIGPCLHFFIGNFFLEAGIAYAKDYSYNTWQTSTGYLPLIQVGFIFRGM